MFTFTRNVIAMALTFILSAAAPAEEKNLLAKPSFEEYEAGALPDGLTMNAKPAEGFKAWIGEHGRTGKRSLAIKGEGDWGVVAVQRLEINRKKSHLLRGYVKAEGQGVKATIKFDYFDEGHNYVGSTTPGDAGDTAGKWIAVSLTDRAGDFPKATFVSVAAALAGKGSAWFDDLELIALEAPAAGGNLLTNGSFENRIGDKPAQLWTGAAEGGKVDAKISEDKPKDGKACLHLKGNADWAVATLEKIKVDKTKTYTLTGSVRAKSGTAQIKIDYFEGDTWLGSTFGTDVTEGDWAEQSVESELGTYPAATHVSATCVGTGEFEACFDKLSITAK